MEWYYARGEERIGPVSESEFQSLTAEGVIAPDTLVWQEGMIDWLLYSALPVDTSAPPEPAVVPESLILPPEGQKTCAECGLRFPEEDMVQYKDAWICAACKPVFFQRLQESGFSSSQLRYAGFWIRFFAKFLDGIIVFASRFALNIVLNLILISVSKTESIALAGIATILVLIAQITFGMFYITFFLGQFGATPGKMAFGLRVVRPEGARITYWRAFGRYWGEMLNLFTLFIGYIIAAFDMQKRGLHDRICDTRVVYKQ